MSDRSSVAGDVLLIGPFRGLFGIENSLNREREFRQIFDFNNKIKSRNVFLLGGNLDANICSLDQLMECVVRAIEDIKSRHTNLYGAVLCLGSFECDSEVFSQDGIACCLRKLVKILRKQLGVTKLVISSVIPRLQPSTACVDVDQFAANVASLNAQLKRYAVSDRQGTTYFYNMDNKRFAGEHFRWHYDDTQQECTREFRYELYNAIQKLDGLPLGVSNICIKPRSRKRPRRSIAKFAVSLGVSLSS